MEIQTIAMIMTNQCHVWDCVVLGHPNLTWCRQNKEECDNHRDGEIRTGSTTSIKFRIQVTEDNMI